MKRAARALLTGLLLAQALPPVAACADTGPPASVAAIRSARDRYNAALVSRDLPRIRVMLVDDYIGLPGSSGNVVRGGDAMLERFAVAFSDPAFITYVRHPTEIRIAKPPERAMERGQWMARYRGDKPGRGRISGEYLAVWVPGPQGWQLRSESFVTLAGVTAR